MEKARFFRRPFRAVFDLDGEPDTSCLANFQLSRWDQRGRAGRAGPVNAKRLGVRHPSGALERGNHPDAAASRQSAANVTEILDGGFLPKAATRKRRGRGAHARGWAMKEIR